MNQKQSRVRMKIQPIDDDSLEKPVVVAAVVTKSRIKRMFEKQFPRLLRTSSLEKCVIVSIDVPNLKKAKSDLSSVCLDKMVENFIEQQSNNDKHSSSSSCLNNCFNGIRNSDDDDEADDDDEDKPFDLRISFSTESFEILKSLVQCSSDYERNLQADVANIVEKGKSCKRKDHLCRKIVTDGLLLLGYEASVCKSRWDKTPSFPAGEYEYIDVIYEGERLLIDIDFRSEFEIARSSKSYKTILHLLPFIFVGKSDRLQRIIGIVTEAAKRSMKKKGMHVPPWRKTEYVRSKWLSPLQVTKVSKFEQEKDWIPPKMTVKQNGVKQIITGFSVMKN